MKHSKGPWSKTRLRREGWIQFRDANGELIADVWIEDRDPKSRATARLILKAPELLAMMPKVIEWDCPFLSCDLGCEKEAGCPLVAAWKLLDEITGEETDG